MRNVTNHQSIIDTAYDWACSQKPPHMQKEHHCETRDRLEARIEHLRKNAVQSGMDESTSYLLHAILSEIGGNSFDHNLGQWHDAPGALLICEIGTTSTFVLADRGQGIRSTLSRVETGISSDEEALKIAFTKQISGRAPEKRGNGLKFVRKTLLDDGMDLMFHSGNAIYNIADQNEEWSSNQKAVPGCLAVISLIQS